MSILSDLLFIFYPRLCAGCGTPLIKGEEVLCLSCLADLPKSNYRDFSHNPVADLFAGRINIVCAASFCHFDKGGKMQHILHQLKYKGRKDVGCKLGMLFGSELIRTKEFNAVDAIVPVPLHKRKQKTRGYNQSLEICKGISESMKKPLISGNLIRNIHSSSQTLKGRYERWQNVNGIFSVKKPYLFEGKHLLLVDDIVTTGATLESCCQALLKINGVSVSVASLANA